MQQAGSGGQAGGDVSGDYPQTAEAGREGIFADGGGLAGQTEREFQKNIKKEQIG